MKKKMLFLGIVTTLLIACGKENNKGSVAESNKIKIMAVLQGTEVPDANSSIEKAVESKTGYDLDITWIPDSSYNDRVAITLASDDVPNLMILKDKNATTINSVKKGAFWQLDKYLKDYPNLSKENKNIALNASFNGDTYGIYRQRELIRSSIIFNKKWLDKLGLKEPETLDELTEVLRQFKENDPDGNGKDDTYGLIVPKWPGTLNTNSPFDQMSIWFGAPNTAKVVDGEIVMDFMTPEYLEALRYFKMLYDKGYMNKDFAVMDAGRWDEPFVNEKGGVIIDVQSRGASLQNKMLAKNGDDGQQGDSYVSIVGNVKTKNGDFILPTLGYFGILAIPKQGARSEGELRKVLDLLDKMNTKEVNDILAIGVEGEHYSDVDGKFTPKNTPEVINEILNYSQLKMNVPNHEERIVDTGSRLQKMRKEIKESYMDRAVFNPISSVSSEVFARKGAQLQNIMGDARIQFIAGQIDEKGYQDAIELWRKTGGDEYVQELNKLYKETIKNN